MQTDNQERFETYEVRSKADRKIVVWGNEAHAPHEGAPPIVIGPGFGRRMHNFSPLAQYLARNGFNTYRYDCLDHVGLSDGEMLRFTMSEGYESMRAVTAWVAAKHARPAAIVATSLSARMAYQLAADAKELVAFLVTAVGVVHCTPTIGLAMDGDFLRMGPEEIKATPIGHFEKLAIESYRFCNDAHDQGWSPIEGTIDALKRAPQPIVNFTANDDTWVDADEVKRAFEEGDGGPRKLYRLLQSGHDFGRNAAARQVFLTKVVEVVHELSFDAPMREPMVEPSFKEMTSQAIAERRLQRGTRPKTSRKASADKATADGPPS